MQCPLCDRILEVESTNYTYTCYCSDDPLPCATENMPPLNFEGAFIGKDDQRFTIWFDMAELGIKTFIFSYETCVWDLVLETNGDSQLIQRGTNKVSPEEAVALIKRCQNLKVFL